MFFFSGLPLDRIENILIMLRVKNSHQIEITSKNFLKHHINLQNIFEIWDLAEKYDNETLISLSKEFVLNNFEKVTFSKFSYYVNKI